MKTPAKCKAPVPDKLCCDTIFLSLMANEFSPKITLAALSVNGANPLIERYSWL